MFPSISKAIPQTQVTTSFMATGTINIVPITPFTIKVNGLTPSNPNSVTAHAGDSITATITTPNDWLWHAFYHYEINGVPSSFAVVNKSSYTISVKPEDAIKRWYMYEPTTYTSTYKATTGTNYSVTFSGNYGIIPTDYHIVLNPLDNSIYFFDVNGVQVSKVILPAAPLDYVKIPEKQSVIVLVRGGEAYEIFLDNATSGLAPFYAKRNYSEFTGDNFVFQLPGEDLLSYLRRARAKKAIPPATCVTYDGMFVIAGGNGTVWIVDPFANFTLRNSFDIDEYVMNIAPLPNNGGVIFVTQSQKVYKMDYAGNFTELYRGIALWQPALFNGKVYIPEGNVGLLKVYNPATNSFQADIPLNDFSPSYITVNGGKMYVAGHDTERVLVFDSAMHIEEKLFPDKVTLVSALNGTMIASHWMKSFKVLNLADLRRIVTVEFRQRRGPVSHVGTNVAIVKTLGNDEVFARTPSGTWLWVNGQRAYTEDVRGSLLIDGDIISINRACKIAGLQRTNCIIGDVVYDYDVEAVPQTYYPRNIDLPVMQPGDRGVHTRTITLPNFFTPCLMSIEYGVVKVNGAYYYGDFLVTAGDIVSIEIQTRNNSILPVFTMGARQFVIPVSTSANYTPVVYEHSDLEPSTTVVDEIIFTEFPSLFDYIIPGYYDISIKKNNIDVTGNYFQQFGVNDKMTVTHISSRKLYDSTDVYILGPVNYKFTAKNKLGTPVNYLDYGNLVYPYLRQLNPYPSGDSYFLDSNYGNVIEYVTPTIQYITANITISGLVDSNVNANISVVGGDSYFVLDGNLINNTTINVWNGNNLALARNVISYFDVPVEVIQHLPTGDEDGWADITVGKWGIINQEMLVEEIKEEPSAEFTNAASFSWLNTSEDIRVTESAVERSNLVRRTINSFGINLDLSTSIDSSSYQSTAMGGKLVTINSAKETASHQNQFQPDQNFGEHTWVNSSLGTKIDARFHEKRIILENSSREARDVPTQRNLNAYDLEFDRDRLLQEIGALLELDRPTEIKDLGYVNEYYQLTQMLEDSAGPQTVTNTETALFGYFGSRLVPNLRLALASLEYRDLPAAFVDFGSQSTFSSAGAAIKEDPQQWDLISGNPVKDDASKGDVLTNDSTVDEPLMWNVALKNSLTLDGSKTERDVLGSKMEEKGSQSIREPIPTTNGSKSFPAIEARQTFLEQHTNFERELLGYHWNKDIVWKHNKYLGGIFEKNNTARTMLDYFNWGSGQVTLGNIEFRNPTPTYFNVEHREDTIEIQYFVKSELISIDPLRLQPTLVGNLNYMNINLVNAIEHDISTAVELFLDKTDDTYTTSITPISLGGYELTKSGVAYQIEDLASLLKIKSTVEKYSEGKSNLVESVVNRSEVGIEIPMNMFYGPEQWAEITNRDYTYNKENTPDLKTDQIYYDKEQISAQFNQIYYDKENTIGGTNVKIVLNRDPLDSKVAQIYYGIETQFSDTYLKPSWGFDNYGDDVLMIPKVEIERIGLAANAKLMLERDRPQLYFTAVTVPEIEQGIIWDNDISVEYGAFVTEDDAIEAARKYSNFRPQLIMDTNLWTYRVLLDTQLVCPLPAGRYAIAWLIRGG